MKIIRSILFMILFNFPFYAAAKALTCPEYFPNPDNKLNKVMVFNQDHLGTYPLVPFQGPSTGNVLHQYWEGMHTFPSLKAFFTCSYLKTKDTITKEIPNTITICKYTSANPTRKNVHVKVRFYCK